MLERIMAFVRGARRTETGLLLNLETPDDEKSTPDVVPVAAPVSATVEAKAVKLECRKCGQQCLLPEETPPFGTAIVCTRCHASLTSVYERDPGCPAPIPREEVRAQFGYTGCVLDHPPCPLCRKINYSVVFPDRANEVAWFVNELQQNPRAAYFLKLNCVHCQRDFVVEWDRWPFSSKGCDVQRSTDRRDQVDEVLSKRDALIAELCAMGMELLKSPRARAIGEELYLLAGRRIEFMLLAHERITNTPGLGPYAGQTLSWCWNRIGVGQPSPAEGWLA